MKKKMGKILSGIVLSFTILLAGTAFNIHAEDNMSLQTPISLTTSVADNADTRAFIITNNTNENLSAVRYWGSNSSSAYANTVAVAAGSNVRVTVPAAAGLSLIAEYDGYRTSIKAYDAYNMPVYYLINNNVVATYSVVNSGSGTSYTAPLTYMFHNESYSVSGNNYKEVPFGTKSLSFNYEKINMPVKTSTVIYVDQNNVRLTEKTFTVTEKDGGHFQPDAAIRINGKDYKLMSGQAAALNPTYAEGGKSYTYRYMLQDDSIQRAYNITVQYLYNNVVLETNIVSVYPGQSVSYDTSDSVVANKTEYRRSAGEAKTIQHEYDNATRLYKVKYEKVKVNEPYDITVNYVNLENGKVLETHKTTVDVNKTIHYDVKNSFDKDNETYILSGSQSKTVTHTFGQDQTVYNVYYNLKGKEVTSYDVKIIYFDITKNTVLSSKTVKAELNKALLINVPSTYEKGNNKYVLLGGQNTSNTHDFYSRTRTHIYFYRDVNDTANAETVVQPGVNGTVVVGANQIINVDEQGNAVIRTEDGDLTINDENEVVKDNETPLSKGKKTTKKDSFPMMYVYTGVGFLILAGILVFFFMKKRKKEKA
ncbi:hypothetical protein GSF08_03105 [Clostridiaceae bacterium DONG20-135]|uniref:MucBP domain-containing protein n=1 Tax=Copranaerobaculum intestinale TaxID=2692629 RepID=A0A6N8U3Z6_9FIRM|nr:hypothetical protein [Copranaerobaculum intestinale]MXQ72928.1 hypothetical protein [Copranaerobaculum intestinale]